MARGGTWTAARAGGRKRRPSYYVPCLPSIVVQPRLAQPSKATPIALIGLQMRSDMCLDVTVQGEWSEGETGFALAAKKVRCVGVSGGVGGYQDRCKSLMAAGGGPVRLSLYGPFPLAGLVRCWDDDGDQPAAWAAGRAPLGVFQRWKEH